MTSHLQKTQLDDAFEKTLVGTLRLHKSPITCIKPFYLPSTLKYVSNQNRNTQYHIFTTSVISADESGLIIWWNLATRRPLGMWKAHDESILTLKQLGLSWKLDKSLSSTAAVPIMGENFGQLLTHSKDGSMRIWRLIDLVDNSDSGFTYTCLLKKRVSSEEELKSVIPPIMFEMPINVLNFANVDLSGDNILITPATTDSEGFDLYSIDTQQAEEYKKLKRMIQNYKPQNIVSAGSGYTDADEEIGGDIDLTKRNGTGVIMKVKWINNEIFVVGYENGQITSYTYDIKKNKIEVLFTDKSLIGNPITSICYDSRNKAVIGACTGSKLMIMKLGNLDSPTFKTSVFDVKHKGINDVYVDVFSNSVGLITWDGYTRIYRYDDQDVLVSIFKLKRPTPAISNSKEATDNEDGDISQIRGLQGLRASAINFTMKQVDPGNSQEIREQGLEIVYTNGRYKNLVKRNREESFGERWMFVGYGDGRISVFSLK